jgi:hypothetical protein
VFEDNFEPIDIFAFAQLDRAGVELSDERKALVESVTA